MGDCIIINQLLKVLDKFSFICVCVFISTRLEVPSGLSRFDACEDFLRRVLGQKLAVAQLFKFLMVEPRFYSHFSYFFLVFNNVVLFRRRASKIRGATWCLTRRRITTLSLMHFKLDSRLYSLMRSSSEEVNWSRWRG